MPEKLPKLSGRFVRDWLAPQWRWFALGAAFAGVLAVWLPSAAIHSSFARSDLPPRLKTENRTTRPASSFFL